MKKNLLNILACPDCQSPLELSVFEEKQFKTLEVIEGFLSCKKCVQLFPIIEGIPRFIPNAVFQYPDFVKKHPKVLKLLNGSDDMERSMENFLKTHGSTQERFGFEWMNYPGTLPEDEEIFLAETQIPAGEWRDKRVMDAGCGMGRYSRVAHKLGAEVVALDLSGALVRLWDLARESDRLHLIQGNLLSPPLREKVFDVVYSIGVIHHTPSAQKTFQKLSRLVRFGGQLTLWVYGTAGRFENFKTNPLRSDRQGLKKQVFFVWMIVLLRELLSDTLRLFTVHLPHRLLYWFCYPLALIGKIPLIKYLTFSVHPFWRVRLQENFDWLSPPYQSHHTKEEVIRWFEENGFEILKVLPHGFVPKSGVLGRKK